jgi:hypothetical protein
VEELERKENEKESKRKPFSPAHAQNFIFLFAQHLSPFLFTPLEGVVVGINGALISHGSRKIRKRRTFY